MHMYNKPSNNKRTNSNSNRYLKYKNNWYTDTIIVELALRSPLLSVFVFVSMVSTCLCVCVHVSVRLYVCWWLSSSCIQRAVFSLEVCLPHQLSTNSLSESIYFKIHTQTKRAWRRYIFWAFYIKTILNKNTDTLRKSHVTAYCIISFSEVITHINLKMVKMSVLAILVFCPMKIISYLTKHGDKTNAYWLTKSTAGSVCAWIHHPCLKQKHGRFQSTS